MHRLAAFIAAATLLFVVHAVAQSAPQLPKVSISLPADVPSEKVGVRYVLYGPFGAHGSDGVQKSGSQLIEIPAAVEGRPADQLKMFVWAPGCKIATFDILVQGSSNVHVSFFCSPLSNNTLVGQIKNAHLHGRKPAEVRVNYLASRSAAASPARPTASLRKSPT
jgi:hypothetical protein